MRYCQWPTAATALVLESPNAYEKEHKECDMINETQAARNRLIKDFKAVMRDAEELLKVTAGQTGDKVDAVRARAEQSLNEARRKIDEMENDLMDRTVAAATATDELVHRNPWQAVAIATAIGFMLGMLSGRR